MIARNINTHEHTQTTTALEHVQGWPMKRITQFQESSDRTDVINTLTTMYDGMVTSGRMFRPLQTIFQKLNYY